MAPPRLVPLPAQNGKHSSASSCSLHTVAKKISWQHPPSLLTTIWRCTGVGKRRVSWGIRRRSVIIAVLFHGSPLHLSRILCTASPSLL